jgi:acetoin utilization protein AcuB
MYVGTIMHTDLITVSPETTIVEASELIEKHNIEHLLVVRKGKLVGLVSDRDLKQNWASPATTLSAHELSYLLQKVQVSMIMVKTVVTTTPDTTIERAAYIMQTNNISSLPVMAGEELVGIVTGTDVMAVLLQAIGLSDDSVRICILVDDAIGSLADVTTILKQQGINIQSLFCWPATDHPGIIHLVMRVAKQEGDKAMAALEQKGFRMVPRYVKDLGPYLPADKA